MPTSIPYWLLLVSIVNTFITLFYEYLLLPLLTKYYYSFKNKDNQ